MTNQKESFFSGFPPSIYVLAAVFLWSTGGLFIKMTTVSGFEVNAGRCLLAALTIGLLTYKKGLKVSGFTLLTALFYAGTLSCFAIATKKTTAANAIFLQYTAPVYILLLAPLILKERFKWRDLLTVAFCLGGMSLFFLDSTPNANLSAASQFEGNIYALASGVFFGFYFTLLRHPRMLAQNPAISVFYGNILSVLIMLPFILINYSFWTFNEVLSVVSHGNLFGLLTMLQTTLTRMVFAWTTNDILAVGFLGVFQIGLAYYLFTYGISKGVRSLDASIIGFIEPLLNPVWVFLLLNEKPSNWAIIGGAVIIATIIAHTVLNAKTKLESAVQ